VTCHPGGILNIPINAVPELPAKKAEAYPAHEKNTDYHDETGHYPLVNSQGRDIERHFSVCIEKCIFF
jgi:hypothetical protein